MAHRSTCILLTILITALSACERTTPRDKTTGEPTSSSDTPTPMAGFSLDELRERFGCDTRAPVAPAECAALGGAPGLDEPPELPPGTLLVGRTWTLDPGIPGVKRVGLVGAGIGRLQDERRLSLRGLNLPEGEDAKRELAGLDRQLDDVLPGKADTITVYSVELEGMLRTLPGFNMAIVKRDGARWSLADEARTSLQATETGAWVLRRLVDASKPADAWHVSILRPVTLAQPKKAEDADVDTARMRELLKCAGGAKDLKAEACAVLDGFDAGTVPEVGDTTKTWFGRVRRPMGGAFEGHVAAVVRQIEGQTQLAVGEVRPENPEQREDTMALAASVLDGAELAPKNSALAFVTTIGGNERAWESARMVGASSLVTRKGVFQDQPGLTLEVYARQKSDRLFLIAQDPLSGITWFAELGLIP